MFSPKPRGNPVMTASHPRSILKIQQPEDVRYGTYLLIELFIDVRIFELYLVTQSV